MIEISHRDIRVFSQLDLIKKNLFIYLGIMELFSWIETGQEWCWRTTDDLKDEDEWKRAQEETVLRSDMICHRQRSRPNQIRIERWQGGMKAQEICINIIWLSLSCGKKQAPEVLKHGASAVNEAAKETVIGRKNPLFSYTWYKKEWLCLRFF